MYRFVVDMFACPAFVITAIGDEPAAASFVIAVCRRSWNGRGLLATAAALRAAVSACLNVAAPVGKAAGGGPTVIVNGVIGDYEEAARKIQTALLRIQNREGGLGFQ
jgi:hypothetical protein